MIVINTTNPLKKKAINRVLRVSDDKLEEVINIIELLNNPQLTNKEVRGDKILYYGIFKSEI